MSPVSNLAGWSSADLVKVDELGYLSSFYLEQGNVYFERHTSVSTFVAIH